MPGIDKLFGGGLLDAAAQTKLSAIAALENSWEAWPNDFLFSDFRSGPGFPHMLFRSAGVGI